MQAYRIHHTALAACWHLNAACTTGSPGEPGASGKRHVMPGLPGRAKRLSPYLHGHRRRWR